MNLVDGLPGDLLFEPQHEQRGPRAQNSIHISQQRILESMAEIQITVAEFQAPTGGNPRKSPYSKYQCFKFNGSENNFTVGGFGIGGDPSNRTSLDF